MKFNILSYIVILFTFISCQSDEKEDYSYVNDIYIHIKYQGLGEEYKYTTHPVIKLTNNTEQTTSVFNCDSYGKVVLDSLLPGEYTMNIMTTLTEEEMNIATGKQDSKPGSLSGFITNIKLRTNQNYKFEEFNLYVAPDNPIILKELYYAGSKMPSGMTYRNDGFYTIHNNSEEGVDISEYYIASVENFGGIGVAGPLWPGEQIGNYKNIYAMTLWKIVSGDDKYILDPGADAVIAVMAAPHNKNVEYNLSSPVDLSEAQFEAYIDVPKNTYPDFKASNMELIFWPDYSYLWRLGVFGQGVALLKFTREELAGFETTVLPESFQDPFENEEYWLCKKIPVEYVVDAVDLIQNRNTTVCKRFPPMLDAGAATVETTYAGKSVIRKVREIRDKVIVYQDTNNSTEDFIINDNPLNQ